MAKDNAYLCTFDPDAPCSTCGNDGEIFCKPDDSKVVVSHLLEASFLIMAVFGTGLTSILLGSLWPVLVFSVFSLLFFLVIQPRITCSHCPYYAEDRLFLHCTENHFSPKIWRYHPEPISWWEKIGYRCWFCVSWGVSLVGRAVRVVCVFEGQSQCRVVARTGWCVSRDDAYLSVVLCRVFLVVLSALREFFLCF